MDHRYKNWLDSTVDLHIEELLSPYCNSVRTYLNKMLASTQFLIDKSQNLEMEEELLSLKKNIDQLLSLNTQIVEFQKIQRGENQFEEIPFSLRSSLSKILTDLHLHAKDHGKAFSFVISPQLPDQFLGAPAQIKQIFEDLVKNYISESTALLLRAEVSPDKSAANASQKMGLHFTLEEIDFSSQPLVGEVREKTQMGFSEIKAVLSKLLIHEMGGSVWIEKKEANHQIFHFLIPIKLSSQSSSGRTRLVRCSLEDKKVLVVDPDLSSQLWLQNALKSWQMKVHVCSSAFQAEQYLASVGPFDFIIVEKNLEDQNAFSFLATVSKKYAPSLKNCLMLTADAERGDAAKARSIGFKGYFTKPLQSIELWEAFQYLLQDKNAFENVFITRHSLKEEDEKFDILVINLPVSQRLAFEQLQALGHRLCFWEKNELNAEKLSNTDYDLLVYSHQGEIAESLKNLSDLRSMEKQMQRHTPLIIYDQENSISDQSSYFELGIDAVIHSPLQEEILKNLFKV